MHDHRRRIVRTATSGDDEEVNGSKTVCRADALRAYKSRRSGGRAFGAAAGRAASQRPLEVYSNGLERSNVMSFFRCKDVSKCSRATWAMRATGGICSKQTRGRTRHGARLKGA